jgi:hypothetical protein
MNFVIALVLASQLTTPHRPDSALRLDVTGTCESGNDSVDMSRVMFLENRTLVIEGATGPLQLRLNGESFAVEEIGEHSEHRTYAEPIDAMVEPDENLDIELKLALIGSRLALYWRETYQNRFYRQGLLAIEGRAFFNPREGGLRRPLCEGSGGSQSAM